jgi:hypothetical protein
MFFFESVSTPDAEPVASPLSITPGIAVAWAAREPAPRYSCGAMAK